jgi:diguanylate cyclase (GGDEF)-like protein/PAS domain S-box-containing protein
MDTGLWPLTRRRRCCLAALVAAAGALLVLALSTSGVPLAAVMAAITAPAPLIAISILGLAALCAVLGLGRERQRRRRLEEALDLLEHGFALYDADDRLVVCNRAYREIYPRSASRMVPGVRFADLIRYGVEQGEYLEARDDPEAWIAMRLARHELADGTRLLQPLADGRILEVSEHRTADGGRVGLRVDVTALEHSRRALAESEARFRALAEHAPIGIWQLDSQGQTVYANPALCRMLGAHPADLTVLPPEAVQLVREGLSREAQATAIDCELTWPLADGRETRSFLVIATALAATAGGGLLLTFLDITSQRRAQAELEHLALHDPLTGLGNRRLFAREADRLLQQGEPCALVLVDIDDLEEFNARFGHGCGDRLLVACGEGLRRFTRAGDLVFRLGSDEFALLLPGMADPADLTRILERLAAALAILPGLEAEASGPAAERSPAWPGACMAAALAPRHGRSRETLLANAEFALSLAKQRGRGQILVYDPGLADRCRRRRELLRRLERAIARDELQLVIQPQIDLADGRVRGGEVLLRWFDALEQEPVPPEEFITLAEQTGLIEPLDTWVLGQACAWLAGCGLDGERLPRLSVNVSAAHVARPELPRLVAELLARHGLVPARLEIEVTEHVVLADRDGGRRFLGELHEIGVGLALDDFGTGYASLAYLADLPFDRIKIDRSFIRGLEQGSRQHLLVRAITGLARGLGLEVVAEGVETAAQREVLVAEGIDLAQGYLIARPMPLERFSEWLQSWDVEAWRRAVTGGRHQAPAEARLSRHRAMPVR